MHMTIVWFVIWLIANNVGAHEPLVAAPPNAWAATLILAIALDLNRPAVDLGKERPADVDPDAQDQERWSSSTGSARTQPTRAFAE